MKRILLIVFASLAINSFAQEEKENKWSYNASYYSLNVTQPGLKLGAERNLSSKVKVKTSGKEKRIQKNVYASFNLGYYYLPKTSSNFFIETAIGRRRIGNKNFIHGVELGLMAIKSFNYGKTYEVTDDSHVEKIAMAGHIYTAPKLNYMFGYRFKNNMQIGVKPGIFLQFGHFKGFIPQGSFETSISYKF